MIDSIESVEKLGRFENFVWQKDVHGFGKINLVLGYNGSGKSTLSNVLRLYSDKEIDGGPDANVSVRIDGKKSPFKPTGKKIPIYVFNSDFTAEHVYQGTIFTFKPFDEKVVTKEQLKNPKIAELESKVAATKGRMENKQKENRLIESRFDEFKKAMSKELNTKVKGSRMPSFGLSSRGDKLDSDKLRAELDGLFQSYDVSTKQEQLTKDIEALNNLSFDLLSIDLKVINTALAKKVGKVARKRAEERIEKWSHCSLPHQNVVEWFEGGNALLKYAKKESLDSCPLCGSRIDHLLGMLIEDYDGYFSEEYSNLMETLASFEAGIVRENRKGISALMAMADRYKSLQSKDVPDWGVDDQKTDGVLKKASNLLSQKGANIEKEHLELDTEHFTTVKEYNDTIGAAENERDNLVALIETAMVDPNEIITKIKDIIPKICNAEVNDSSTGNQLARHGELEKQIQKESETLSELMGRRSQEMASLRKESKYVNAFLHRLGISHFQISIEKRENAENIVVRFTGGQTRTELRHSLSEGEKTALAFAYFLSKIQYEIGDNSNTSMSETIVVIDDPVSSLDEERLHSTACLIQDQFAECCQMIVLSHNISFMRFLSNVIGYPREEVDGARVGTRHDYYLCSHEGTLKNLPRQLRNYSTSYFQKLDEIFRFFSGQIDYEIAKTFIPAYIRVVLESFFSFKLSLVAQGSSSDGFLSPGLDKIISNLRGCIGLFAKFKKVGDIDSASLIDMLFDIKRITDPQVHGTPNDVTDSRFVSDVELRTISKNALDIITFIDARAPLKTHKEFTRQ